VGRNRLAGEAPARRAAFLGGSLLTSGLLAGWRLSAATERRAVARTLEQERRRVAADVHDLIMQDLALALANARTLANRHSGDSQASIVVSAGERALTGARAILRSLAAQASSGSTAVGPRCASPPAAVGSGPLVRAIEASAQAAARSTRLVFDAAGVPGSARADGPTRAALLHVAREAVTNATKHASPNAIEVTLTYTDRWRLTVRDEGEGFDAADTDNGFGLTSMRAQARALGGVLRVTSAADRGTTVEVILP
jgi:signal transduction histidine kinase